MMLSKSRFYDFLLVCFIGVGLIYSRILPGILLLAVLRHKVNFLYRDVFSLLSLSAILGGMAFISHPLPVSPESLTTTLQTLYIWIIPFAIAIYGPRKETAQSLSKLIGILFVFDFIFNISAAFFGVELLGRTISERNGFLFGSRFGGVFHHEFYSAEISIVALAIALGLRKKPFVIGLILINLLFSGAWRALIAMLTIGLFYFLLGKLNKVKEIGLIVLLSFLSVFATIQTSDRGNVGYQVNHANSLRIVAWETALSKIVNHPWFGAGFSSTKNMESVDETILDENNIAESWYLGSALNFGIPYTLVTFLAYLLVYFKKRSYYSNSILALIFPYLIVDFVYGGLMTSTLVLPWIWILLLIPKDVSPEREPGLLTRQGVKARDR